MTLVLVAMGAAIGAPLRYLVTTQLRAKGATPAGGTLAVNIVGSLMLGLVAGWASRGAPGWVLPFLGIGFCGSFTTFSAFALEVANALRARAWSAVAGITGMSIALPLLAVYIGWALAA
ncbi:CrcB family protein [Janibacter sp. GXQ6167]|uniref:fluoride efflux transporter FluC n=1 Tax=Janibacter sp. GXQ6167 TaxID=3240791 RepID=UPI0035265BD6